MMLFFVYSQGLSKGMAKTYISATVKVVQGFLRTDLYLINASRIK